MIGFDVDISNSILNISFSSSNSSTASHNLAYLDSSFALLDLLENQEELNLISFSSSFNI